MEDEQGLGAGVGDGGQCGRLSSTRRKGNEVVHMVPQGAASPFASHWRVNRLSDPGVDDELIGLAEDSADRARERRKTDSRPAPKILPDARHGRTGQHVGWI